VTDYKPALQNTNICVNRSKQTQYINCKRNFFFKQTKVFTWKLKFFKQQWHWPKLHKLGSNGRLPLYVSYPNTKFSVNRSKPTQVIERNNNLYFCNRYFDLAHRHLIRNQKLPLDISYPQTKSCINWPKKSENWYSIFSNSDLDIDHRHLGRVPDCLLM